MFKAAHVTGQKKSLEILRHGEGLNPDLREDRQCMSYHISTSVGVTALVGILG